MKKDIQATNMDLTDAIRGFFDEKIDMLEKYLDMSDESIYAQCEVEKDSSHNKGEVFRAEVNLHMAGADFRAEATEDDLYAAIDKVKEELSKEIRRHKGKQEDMIKKGGREIKDQLKFGNK